MTDQKLPAVPFKKAVGASIALGSFVAMPSKIRADHGHNSSRAPCYFVADQAPEIASHFKDSMLVKEGSFDFCFTRAQVMERLASLLAHGQKTDVECYMTAGRKGEPVLREGFLRHAAELFAEATGIFDTIPTPEGIEPGLRFRQVPRPACVEDQIAATLSNRAENFDRLDTTPIDDAWLIKRLLGYRVSKAVIAEKLGMSVRTVDRLHTLLSLDALLQTAVHEGRRTVKSVLADVPEARGTRAGVKHTTIRNAFRAMGEQDHAPGLLTSEAIYTAQDMLAWGAHIGGVEDAGDVPSEFLAFLDDAPKPVKKKAGRKKKVQDTAPADDSTEAKPAKKSKSPPRKKAQQVKGDS